MYDLAWLHSKGVNLPEHLGTPYVDASTHLTISYAEVSNLVEVGPLFSVARDQNLDLMWVKITSGNQNAFCLVRSGGENPFFFYPGHCERANNKVKDQLQSLSLEALPSLFRNEVGTTDFLSAVESFYDRELAFSHLDLLLVLTDLLVLFFAANLRILTNENAFTSGVDFLRWLAKRKSPLKAVHTLLRGEVVDQTHLITVPTQLEPLSTTIHSDLLDPFLGKIILPRMVELVGRFSWVVGQTTTHLTDISGPYCGNLTPAILSEFFERLILPELGGPKVKGAYYTPEDMRTYLCLRTIYTTLFPSEDDEKPPLTSSELVRRVISSTTTHQTSIARSTKEIRVLDPAVGSGHFLKPMADILLRLRTSIGSEMPEEELRQHIVDHNLYGVDIMPKVVTVARVRLWLWVYETGQQATTSSPQVNNIRAGNSLLGFTKLPKEPIGKTNLDTSFLNIGWRAGKERPTTFFHWCVEFPEVFQGQTNPGFNLIVSNPPYGNLLLSHEQELLKKHSFTCAEVGEVCATFLERETQLLQVGGNLGNVIAGSILVNRRITPLRSFLREHFASTKLSYFGTRPAKLFKVEIRVGLGFCITKQTCDRNGAIESSRAVFFTREQRYSLFRLLQHTQTTGLELGERIGGQGQKMTMLPKVGSEVTRKILLKLRDQPVNQTLGEALVASGGVAVQFRATGGYWLNALHQFPYTSSKVRSLHFQTELEAWFAILLLNSSLFYLYWTVYSNLRDLPQSLVLAFPFPTHEMLQHASHTIVVEARTLEQSLLSNFEPTVGRNGEFRCGKSKPLIDRADATLGLIYGLTIVEVDYLVRYDSHIRPNQA